jgi:hypothetical protein
MPPIPFYIAFSENVLKPKGDGYCELEGKNV